MRDDDRVCLCFGVSKRKIVNYCRRERPPVVSLVSQCLAAGTGCGWCIAYLRRLHEQVMAGDPDPDLPVSPEAYAAKRASYRATGRRDQQAAKPSPEDAGPCSDAPEDPPKLPPQTPPADPGRVL